MSRSPTQRKNGIQLALAAAYAVLSTALASNAALTRLRDEFHFSSAIMGLHGAMFGIALVVSGFFGKRLLDSLGERRIQWLGTIAAFAGIVVFVAGTNASVTLLGAALIGAGTSIFVLQIPSVVAHHFADTSAVVFSRLNIAPALIGIAMGPMLGFAMTSPIGWRWPLFVATAVAAAASVILSKRHLDEATTAAPHQPDTATHYVVKERPSILSSDAARTEKSSFREASARNLAGVFIEFTFGMFIAAALKDVLHLSTPAATGFAALYWVGIASSRATTVHMRALLRGNFELACYLATALAEGIFLVKSVPTPVRVAMLLPAGFSVGSIYTLGVDRMFGFSDDRSAASARAAMISGLSVAIGPVFLGGLADQIGLGRAFVVFPILSLFCAIWCYRSTLPSL